MTTISPVAGQALTDSTPTTPVVPASSMLRPVGLGDVTITGGLWAERQQVNGSNSLEHILGWLERAGWLANFDLAAHSGDILSQRRGREFSDSEVYKWLEAAAWELARTDHSENRPWAELEDRFDEVVARVAAAQSGDGYLGTKFGRPGQATRWSDLEWGHELYCIGHLLQAAVACHRSGRHDHQLVQVATAAADHVWAVFGPDGNQGVCGHPEIELGLIELGRVLGDDRFVDQAALFVDRRGHGTLEDIEFGRSYYQDDVPVREADVLRGHAVRANYLAAAAIDVANQRGDVQLLDAVLGQNQRAIERRTYVTGGQGSHHQDEGFGLDWVLPPDRAYSETCAAIGSIMVAWRLLLQTGEATYGDQIERALYNVVATAVADDGRAFFYANPLHQRVEGETPTDDHQSRRASSSMRAPWFDVSCCPTNVARTFASLSSLIATVSATGVQVHQYADADLDLALANAGGEPTGDTVRLRMRTRYPEEGQIEIAVIEAPPQWELTLRVPEWAAGATLLEAGAVQQVGPGTVSLQDVAVGTVVVLDLDLAPVVLRPHPNVDAIRGCVAVQRGPELWALESTDLVAAGVAHDVADVRMVEGAGAFATEDGVSIKVRPTRPGTPGVAPGTTSLDAAVDPDAAEERVVGLVRYRDWASRGPATMRVWIPVGDAADPAETS